VLPTAHSQHSRQIKHIFARAHMEAPFSPKWCALSRQQVAEIFQLTTSQMLVNNSK
jgi:hypothetical protein